MLSDLRQDLTYALRLLVRAPAFTGVIVLTLALGIGANAAIFSAVDAILLRDAPIADAGRVVTVSRVNPDGSRSLSMSYPLYADVRDSGVFDGVVAFASIGAAFDANGTAEAVNGEIVSGNYFDVLGIGLAAGRGFAADEDRAGSPVRVVVVSHAFWKERLAADPGALGRTIRLNGNPFAIVGVAPAGFAGLVLGRAPDLFVPMATQPEMRPPSAGVRRQLGHANLLIVRESGWLNVAGRRRGGESMGQTTAALGVAAGRISASGQSPVASGFAISRLGEGPGLRSAVRPLLRVLTGAVLLVLLIACANVAGMLSARAVSRRREVAIRMAIGAGTGRLIRQWLAESLLLALLGSVGAVAVASWFTPGLYRFGLPESIDLRVNGRVLAFTMFAAIASGVMFGLAPALQALRRDSLGALKEEGGAVASGRHGTRLRSAFVVLQVVVSVLLLVAAGLFLRTLRNAYAVDLGFSVDSMLVADVNLEVRNYPPVAGQEVYRRLIERLNGLPGVRGAALSRVAVLSGGARSTSVSLDGRPVLQDGTNGLPVRVNVVSDMYLETMGIPILAGRSFSPSDGASAAKVAIVSRSLAFRLWRGEDPIGRTLIGSNQPLSVIGVAQDAAYTSGTERDAPPVYYVPLSQNYESAASLYVRTVGDPLPAVAAVRQGLHEIDPQLILARPHTLRDELDRSVGQQRLMATLVGLFGGLALLLAAVGLFGVMSQATNQRRIEIGIRMALGARPAAILSMVLKDGFRLVAVGAVIGLACAWLSARVIETQLFGVARTDPATYLVAVATFIMVALMACAIPAHRAMRVEPVTSLRN